MAHWLKRVAEKQHWLRSACSSKQLLGLSNKHIEPIHLNQRAVSILSLPILNWKLDAAKRVINTFASFKQQQQQQNKRLRFNQIKLHYQIITSILYVIECSVLNLNRNSPPMCYILSIKRTFNFACKLYSKTVNLVDAIKTSSKWSKTMAICSFRYNFVGSSSRCNTQQPAEMVCHPFI